MGLKNPPNNHPLKLNKPPNDHPIKLNNSIDGLMLLVQTEFMRSLELSLGYANKLPLTPLGAEQVQYPTLIRLALENQIISFNF